MALALASRLKSLALMVKSLASTFVSEPVVDMIFFGVMHVPEWEMILCC